MSKNRTVSQEVIDEIWAMIDARHKTAADMPSQFTERLDGLEQRLMSVMRLLADDEAWLRRLQVRIDRLEGRPLPEKEMVA